MSHKHGIVVKTWRTLAALFLCAILGFGQTKAKRPQADPYQTALKQMLSWLPDDTETVIGAPGPFPLPDFGGLSGNNSEQLSSTELELRMHVLPLGLFALKNGGLLEHLKGTFVNLALSGARRFRQPAGLGNTLYEGCDVAMFDSPITLARDSFIKDAATSAVRFEEMAGLRIAVFEEQEEDDVWTTFVGFPTNNIILIATNADYLRTVLERMHGVTGVRALPETLPEWKYVHTRAPVWGLRHYRRLKDDLDPTSPFSESDNLAVGVAFWFEPAVRRMANVTYLSTNANARQILHDFLSVSDQSPQESQIVWRERGPGAIEGSVTLSFKEALYRTLFGVMYMLGHAVSL